MGIFRIDEILQMAMQAEESGRLLYETLANQAAGEPKIAELCRQLAAQEKGHFEKFKAMREATPKRLDSRRLALEEIEFVKSLMEGRAVPAETEAKRIVQENSMAQVLSMAIQAEVGSAAFYRELLAGVDSGDAATVREIIEEEKRHEKMLRDARQLLTARD